MTPPLLSCFLPLIVCFALAAGAPSLPIWPLPAKFSVGETLLYVSPNTTFTLNSQDKSIEEDMQNSFARFSENVFTHRVPGDTVFADGLVFQVFVKVEGGAELQLGIDESYELTIQQNGEIYIAAPTQVGAIHAVESLSQLILFNFTSKAYIIENAPITIHDAPRFPHREILIDTARHFEPVRMLKRILTSMTYSKLNVMHWHLVDSQSFPFDSPTYPELSEMGAFSKHERYSIEDVEDVVEYARMRGIRVVVEIDTPGHARSFCNSHPEICPSVACPEPLAPDTNATFEVLEGLFKDITGGKRGSGLFFDNMIHLGGDEVNTKCWLQSPRISDWLKENNMTGNDAYLYMVSRVQSIAHSFGRDVVGWEEIWDNFGTKLDKSTIIQQWKSTTAVPEAVNAGYRAIWSTDGLWYLDGLTVKWDKMYIQEPCDGVDDHACGNLVIGGGGEMWGETADASDVLQTIWPRMAAIAERLWSPREINDTILAKTRLLNFRCLLNHRGIPAAPLLNPKARSAPANPGSCYFQ